MDELQRQLQKERDLKFEESSKHLNDVKLEVESKRHELEARQKKVEDVVAEVILMSSNSIWCQVVSILYLKLLNL